MSAEKAGRVPKGQARRPLAKSRRCVSLIYVDVVEFGDSHIRRFYADMAVSGVGRRPGRALRDGVSPLTTIRTASRFFLQYYSVELLFGVPNHFGVDDETALNQTVDFLKVGMFKRP